MFAVSCLLLAGLTHMVHGHGQMVIPFTWHDTERVGMDHVGVGCHIPELPPSNSDWPNIHGRKLCQVEWFANNTWIPGRPTIPDWMIREDDAGHGQNHVPNKPWYSPGSAPIFSPCGTQGGNPYGCRDDPSEQFGDCCSYDASPTHYHCGGFAFGQDAEDFSDWPQAANTVWESGSVQDVAWWVGTNHGGGYAYRICRVPAKGITGLTEECFQKGHMDLVGDTSFIKYIGVDELEEVSALRTREGTFPEGSQWTLNPIDSATNNGEELEKSGWVLDKLQVPDLVPGQYVISFRWDCQKTPQVWNVCAYVSIV